MHKGHFFSASETTSEKRETAASVTRGLLLGRAEREQRFYQKVPGEYSFVRFLIILLPPL